MHGVNCTDPTYGDKEIPIPFGGSAGGWGSTAAGCGGGRVAMYWRYFY
ncbi:MAG: hypothetical protein LLF92_09195 [Planctomycetaceae bacterium]|nr:hypothetical protein [Planctomycetaceae bacterium]